MSGLSAVELARVRWRKREIGNWPKVNNVLKGVRWEDGTAGVNHDEMIRSVCVGQGLLLKIT